MTEARPVVAFIPPSCCGAGYFRPLRRALAGRVSFRAVELPGHGHRYREPRLTSADPATLDIISQLGRPGRLAEFGQPGRSGRSGERGECGEAGERGQAGERGERVDAVYGESLGAYIALAAVAALTAPGDPGQPLLIAASNQPPSVRARIATGGIDSPAAAAAVLIAMGGQLPAELLTDPDLAARAHPLIRDDLYLSQSFLDATRQLRIAADLQVLGGTDDPALGDPAGGGLEAWAWHTTGRCEVTMLPGGHLLSATNPAAVADVVCRSLAQR